MCQRSHLHATLHTPVIMAEPDIDSKIESLFAFGVDLDRNEARQLLANHDNNVEAAIGKYFDALEQGGLASLRSHLRNSQAKWDEAAFGGAMYGADDSTIPTFNIDYAPGLENYPHSNVNSRAPTRPPSRTSIASTQAQAGDAPIQSQYIRRGRSARLASSTSKPIAYAERCLGIENQESGFTGSNANFGPATRDDYAPSQWALVPTSTSTEIIADPVPGQRKREEGQPAILKPSSNFNYLSSLIPIIHSIPLFRNALLCPDILQSEYWLGDKWWKGSPANITRTVETTMGRSEAQGLDIIHETQRLMAFLDSTDRIYGSINAMLESDAWRELQVELEDPDDDLLKFLILWGFAFQSHVPNAELNGLLRSTVNVAGAIRDSFALDASVSRDQSRPDLSLYDILDDSFFSSAMGSAHLRETSNVLILRLTSSNTEAVDLGCRIPATLYVDRYLEQNKHVIDGMYSDIRRHEEQLNAIKTQVETLKYHVPEKRGGKRVEALQLLRTSMTAYEHGENEASAKDATVLAQLQQLCASIESKLANLEEQAEQVQKTVAEISGRFKPRVDDGAEATSDMANATAMEITAPAIDGTADEFFEPTKVDYPEGQTPEDAMQHPYHLWGVATRRDVVYVRHPDIKSDVPRATQWWRMQYDSESSNPIIRRDRLSLQEVIERATTESASALLVYANDEAVSAEPLPLPKPLEDFVKRDNLNFLEELQKSSEATGWEDYVDYGDQVQGEWDKTTGFEEDNDWSQITAKEFHSSRARNDSNMSSATLTPNTEVDEGQEMVETNRGASVVAGMMSNASSGTIGRSDNAMDIDTDKLQSKVSFSDVDMEDALEEPRKQHIEVVEKKGG
ncbi:ubiquitin interaction motif [Pyrenophora seminiperda CCB06]|uniref:Ubiquitin interaction motif n=1 Tax=Pyrenophora seminiperda CCB06 TaxID=1302712 RepID=A0A3M7MFX3_9PLEO|nr:ubiquitin interaction motif [Pyrenophora seminiperda CCB06]